MSTDAATIDVIIAHLRATRPELTHFAGAMHRDPAARRVVEEYLLTPTASEADLRLRARTRTAPSATLAEQWGGFAAVHLGMRTTERPGARQDV